MKQVTASEAWKNWFRLLDEVSAGEIVVIDRNGRRVVLRREIVRNKRTIPATPDYSELLRVPDVDHADRWSWEWRRPGTDLHPKPEDADS